MSAYLASTDKIADTLIALYPHNAFKAVLASRVRALHTTLVVYPTSKGINSGLLAETIKVYEVTGRKSSGCDHGRDIPELNAEVKYVEGTKTLANKGAHNQGASVIIVLYNDGKEIKEIHLTPREWEASHYYKGWNKRA
jgi:hypothetical protein